MRLTEVLCARIESHLPRILALRNQFSVKPDGSFVSEGDWLVQRLASDWLREYLPDHGLIAEEDAPFDGVRWDAQGSYVVLDPIDGTENFVSGLKEWGMGMSIYTQGRHVESCIYLPELGELQVSGMTWQRYQSRVVGLSSSLTVDDLTRLPWGQGVEFRIVGCAMYNLLMAARGSFLSFENVKGVNCWDILPGLNLAREAGCRTWVDGEPYEGQILFPVRKYRVRIENARDANS